MQISAQELCSAIRDETRPYSRIKPSRTVERFYNENYAYKLCQESRSLCFAYNDPLFGKDGVVKDATQLYFEAATGALNSIEKLDETVAQTIYRVMDFLASDARISMRELDAYKQQIYQNERAGRELQEHIRKLKNENAKNVEIVQIGVQRLREQEEQIEQQQKSLIYMQYENSHLSALLAAEREYAQTREHDMAEVRYRRDQAIRHNNEITSGSIAVRTAYEHILEDMQSAREEIDGLRAQLEAANYQVAEYAALVRLRDEQMQQLENKKKLQYIDVKNENKHFYEEILMFIAAFAYLGLKISPEYLDTAEIREEVKQFVYHLLQIQAELTLFKKNEQIRQKGHVVDKNDMSARRALRESAANIEFLRQQLAGAPSSGVRTTVIKADKSVQTLKNIVVVTESGLVLYQVDWERKGQNMQKIAVELSELDDYYILKSVSRRKSANAEELNIKADKRLKQQIAAHFVSQRQYARLLAYNRKLSRLLLHGSHERVNQENIVSYLILELQNIGVSSYDIELMLAKVGCDSDVAGELIANAYYVSNDYDDQRPDICDSTQNANESDENEQQYQTTGVCNSLKRTNTPMKRSYSMLMKSSNDCSDFSKYQQVLMCSYEQYTEDLQYIKCLCVNCAKETKPEQIQYLYSSKKEDINYQQKESDYTESLTKERILIKCAAAFKTYHMECVEQMDQLDAAYVLPSENDKLREQLGQYAVQLQQCEQLIVDALLGNSNGVRCLVQSYNRKTDHAVDTVGELVVKSATSVQSYSQPRKSMIYYRYQMQPYSYKTACTQSKTQFEAYQDQICKPILPAALSNSLAEYDKSQISVPGTRQQVRLTNITSVEYRKYCSEEVCITEYRDAYHAIMYKYHFGGEISEHLRIYNQDATNDYFSKPPKLLYPSAESILATQSKLDYRTSEQLLWQDLDTISASLTYKQHATASADIGQASSFYYDIKKFVALEKLDGTVVRDFLKNLEETPSLYQVHTMIKYLLCPAPVYYRNASGEFVNPFGYVLKLLQHSGHGVGRQARDGRRMHNQIVKLQIKIEQARAERDLRYQIHQSQENELYKAASRAVFTNSTLATRDSESNRQIYHLELRSLVENSVTERVYPVLFEWIDNELRDVLINYCSEFHSHSVEGMPQTCSNALRVFKQRFYYLNFSAFVGRYVLVCEPQMESKKLPETGMQIFYIISLPQYAATLKKLAKYSGALVTYRGGYAFVKVPFCVTIKTEGWLIGVIDYLMRFFDQSTRISMRGGYFAVEVSELVEKWASKMYGLSHLVCLLKYHLLIGVLYYCTTLPAAELFYLLYTGQCTKNYLEFLVYVRYILESKINDYGDLADQIFDGLPVDEKGKLKYCLRAAKDVYGVQLVLLSQFQKMRLSLTSWTADHFGSATALPYCEAEAMLRQLLPHIHRAELYQRLGRNYEFELSRILYIVDGVNSPVDTLLQAAYSKVEAADKLICCQHTGSEALISQADAIRKRFYDYYNARFALGAAYLADQFVYFVVVYFIYK